MLSLLFVYEMNIFDSTISTAVTFALSNINLCRCSFPKREAHTSMYVIAKLIRNNAEQHVCKQSLTFVTVCALLLRKILFHFISNRNLETL